ncbi:MAG: hypothetical protein GY851_27395 [bacterium]|nr:hypothetical protein [bacterium]
MDAVSAVGTSAAEFQAKYQVAVLAKQINVTKDMGDMALKLIESAGIGDPAVGNRVNISV